MAKLNKIKKLVEELFWEYNNMSNDGQRILSTLAEILDIKDEKTDDELMAMGLPAMYLKVFREYK